MESYIFLELYAPKQLWQSERELAKAIERAFGGVTTFETQFKTKTAKHFGSGWLWFAVDPNGNVVLLPHSNVGNPTTYEKKPRLTIDV